MYEARDKALPYPAAYGGQGMAGCVPAVEVTHDADLPGVGGPDTEDPAGDSLPFAGVTTQEILQMGLFSLGKAVQPGRLAVGGGFRCHNKRPPKYGKKFQISQRMEGFF